MNETTQWLIRLLIYPGLLTTLILSLLVAKIASMPTPGGGLTRGLVATLAGKGSPLILLGAVAPLFAPVLLPWPGTPASQPLASPHLLRNLWLFWALIELSALLALLPGLRASSPHGVRSAMREAQLGSAGRVMLWAALGVGVWGGPLWTIFSGAGLGLALLAAALALPVAVGWGPFAADPSLTFGGAEAALTKSAAQLAPWGRAIRATALLMLVPLLLIPGIPGIHWALNAALVINIVLLLATVGRLINGGSVRRSLLDGLRWCWWRVLPATILAVIALLVGRSWI